MTGGRRLLVFPCAPGKGDGYSIAVSADVARLAPGPEDVVLHRVPRPSAPQGQVRTLGTPTRAEQVWNLLRGRPSSELSEGAFRRCLEGLPQAFEEVFSGEIFFYRALRHLFPEARIQVRTHNLFSLVRCRQMLAHLPTNARHTLNMHQYSKLEMEILADRNVTMIFITEEELAFARLLSPGLRGECWPVVDPRLAVSGSLHPPTVPRLVHFGSSAAAHTAIGLEILCRRVIPRLRMRMPEVECHLFGHGSERFHDPARGVIGHGRYPGEGLPFGGDALFCIPDIHGMGIKLKVADLLRAGVPFVSTPLGLSGYHLAPDPHILVRELDDWPEGIHAYFQSHGLSGPS
ncbi:hypothetical protein GETHPA_00190 [Geothrix rubra]|uniref:Glycosyltransferase n=1 Tax=Geothrix rubra TaxID=2927977 RepID=A0ABQ5Q2F5_9BACT|nr:hypothetical protein [Geothrix rubra]GLH68486.1 hypothetical protein GETHPA_00190 [Geothrix rubra]